MLQLDDAQRIAGKPAFLSVNDILRGIGQSSTTTVLCPGTFALHAAIRILKQILLERKPRVMPWPSEDQRSQAVIYYDAFFTLGGKTLNAGEAPELWHPGKRRPSDNGWGFVAGIGSHTVHANGKIPDWFVKAVRTPKRPARSTTPVCDHVHG